MLTKEVADQPVSLKVEHGPMVSGVISSGLNTMTSAKLLQVSFLEMTHHLLSNEIQ